MRILLIDPPVAFLEGDGSTRFVQPLGLAYVGAALQGAGHEVRFLLPDVRPYFGDDPWGEIAGAVQAEAPDIIGLTAVTSSYPSAQHTAQAARQAAPDALIVLGGVHASTLPAQALAGAPEIDVVVSGEGEGPMVELAAGRPPWEVPAVWVRDPDTGHPTSPAGPGPPVDDLDALHWPLRTGLVWGGEDSEAHAPAHHVLREALITVRGCPYKCIYCAVPGLDNRRTRYRSATGVADEIEALKERWDVRYLFFHDSVFTLHRQRTLDLCTALATRGLQTPFTCQTRADRIDKELATALAAAGCARIFLGIESGDERSLKKMRKATPLSQITQAVPTIQAAGIACSGYFMVGFPWEDATSLTTTADFATSLNLDSLSLFSATPLPGTELWRLAADHTRTPTHTRTTAPDFRLPQVNLTSMPDATYAATYEGIRQRFERYNAE